MSPPRAGGYADPMEPFVTILFAVTLALVVATWSRRVVIVLAAAATCILVGALDQSEALAAIDLSTIALLAGMMVVVSGTERTGVFEHAALLGLRVARGRVLVIAIMVALITALLSAFLDNLTTILLLAPLVMSAAIRLGVDPVPLLVLTIIASNIGGASTLVGDPPNILIAGATGLSFNEFLVNLAPVALLTLVIVTASLLLLHRRSFVARSDIDVDDLLPDIHLMSGRELWLPLAVLGAVIAGFLLHDPLHLEPATVAVSGAALMLLTAPRRADEVLRGIDWTTIVFLSGLFVLVGALEQVGVLEDVADATRDATAGSRTSELLGILGISALGSALVDNIPFTAAMLPVVEELEPTGGDAAYWWALSLGACFGGNATLIAAAANVACQGIAERSGVHIGFLRFLGWGIPATAISLVIAAAWLDLVHA